MLMAFSQKAKRISHSTSHAECNAASKTVPVGQVVALRYAEPEMSLRAGFKLTPAKMQQLADDGQCPLPLPM